MTPALAAANTANAGVGWLILAALAAAALYTAACAIRPYRPCPHCNGLGRLHTRPGRKTWRRCRHCKGTGLRIRAGRRIWTHLHHTYKRGTR